MAEGDSSFYPRDREEKRTLYAAFSAIFRSSQYNPALAGVPSHLPLAGGGGGGRQTPPCLTRERMAVERQARRRSKGLDEADLKRT